MNHIRVWLDHQKIEPASFRSVEKAEGGVGFEIGFKREDEALIFEKAFSAGTNRG